MADGTDRPAGIGIAVNGGSILRGTAPLLPPNLTESMASRYYGPSITTRNHQPIITALLGAVLTLTALSGRLLAQDAAAGDSGSADTRTQYPALLENSYFSLNVGHIDYPFTAGQLEPGYTAGGIDIPRIAVRAVLIGHQFTPWLAVQAHYARPVRYVSYRNINGEEGGHHVWMHFGGVTAKTQFALGRKMAVYGEGGLGLTSRSGFEIGTMPVVRDAHFANALIGGGVEYRLTPNVDLVAGTLLSTGSGRQRQPRTVFSSGGFRYTLRPLPGDVVEANRRAGYIFPERMVQISYTTDALGYGFNTLVSKKVPIFWGGNVKVARGAAVHYEQNVFHTRKTFALDVGASAGFWRSRDNAEWFRTLSVYPLLRWTLVRTQPADVYVMYSLAGPSFISKSLIDGLATGNAFTFQDFMGMGVFFGRARRLNAGVKINHYSNGNIFTENAGVKIPFTFSVGYTF
jgi:hypothetical protein